MDSLVLKLIPTQRKILEPFAKQVNDAKNESTEESDHRIAVLAQVDFENNGINCYLVKHETALKIKKIITREK